MQLEVDIGRQRLLVHEGTRIVREYAVSTAAHGPGEINGSGCTPRGRHGVRARIGAGTPLHAVFRARRPTGEVWTPALHQQFPRRDWILTRILWLSGLEPGRNRLGCVDTFRRFIYIHGTPPAVQLGQPGSKGCIRMAGEDVIELFEQTPVGTEVEIHE